MTRAVDNVHLGGVYIPLPQSALHVTSAADCFVALTEQAPTAAALGQSDAHGQFQSQGPVRFLSTLTPAGVVLQQHFHISWCRFAARPYIDGHTGPSPRALHLPAACMCTGKWHGGYAKHLVLACLSAGLVLVTGRLPGDTNASLSYPHAAGRSRPDIS